MAFNKTVSFTPTGLSSSVEVKDAYHKIVSVTGGKKALDVILAVYESSTSVSPLWEQKFTFKPSVETGSDNFLAQAYTYLKTLPEFADAVDC